MPGDYKGEFKWCGTVAIDPPAGDGEADDAWLVPTTRALNEAWDEAHRIISADALERPNDVAHSSAWAIGAHPEDGQPMLAHVGAGEDDTANEPTMNWVVEGLGGPGFGGDPPQDLVDRVKVREDNEEEMSWRRERHSQGLGGFPADYKGDRW